MIGRALAAPRRYLGGLSADSRAGLLGLGWSYSSHALQMIVRFGSNLVLSRLLMPDAWGTLAPALAVMFFIEMLSDIGVRPAVARSPSGEDPRFMGTVWTILLVRAVPFCLALVGLSFAMPAFYSKWPALQAVMLALASRPVILALQNPMIFVLFRRLNYRIPFWLDTAQTFASVPVTILLAWQLGSVWALVLGMLFGDVVRLVLSYILCPKPPRPCWDRPAVRELLHFGTSIFLNTLVFGAWLYFDRLAGPKLLDETQIGLFAMAWALAESLDNLIGRGSEVFYSMLSRAAEGDPRRALFRRTARRVGLFLIPGLAFAAAIAPWMFHLLYPPEFDGAAILLGLLTARLILRATGHLQFMYLMMRGEVRIATRSYLISLLFAAAGFVPLVTMTSPNVLGMAVSSVLSMTTFTVSQTFFMWRRGEAQLLPTLLGLFWTATSVAAVLVIYR